MPDFGAIVRRVDATQRRYRADRVRRSASAKKFGDDRGGALAAELTYYGFLSIFPALLVLTTVLGFIGNQDALGQRDRQHARPVPGHRRADRQERRPPTLGQRPRARRRAADPRLRRCSARPRPRSTRWRRSGTSRRWHATRVLPPARCAACCCSSTLGVGMARHRGAERLVTIGDRSLVARVVGFVVLRRGQHRRSTCRVPGAHARRRSRPARCVPGAVLGGIGYSILLSIGTALVQHQLKHSQAVYGQFGLVLGLMAWLALVAQLTMYAAELNVVAQAPALAARHRRRPHRRRQARAPRPCPPGGTNARKSGSRSGSSRTASARPARRDAARADDCPSIGHQATEPHARSEPARVALRPRRRARVRAGGKAGKGFVVPRPARQARSPTPRRSSGSRGWRSRPRGPTCGSARAPTGTCRPPAATPGPQAVPLPPRTGARCRRR